MIHNHSFMKDKEAYAVMNADGYLFHYFGKIVFLQVKKINKRCHVLLLTFLGLSFSPVQVQCEKSFMRVSVEFDRPFYGMIFSKGYYR